MMICPNHNNHHDLRSNLQSEIINPQSGYLRIMLSEKENKHLSKFLSYLLRHNPAAAGLILDEQGWVNTGELVHKIAQQEPGFTLAALQHIVQTNAKQRFRFNEDGTKIRASQGHSIDVELNYEEKQPPALLYHGTAVLYFQMMRDTGFGIRDTG